MTRETVIGAADLQLLRKVRNVLFIRQRCYHLRHEFRDAFFFGLCKGTETVRTQNGIPLCRYRSSGVSGI